MSHSDPISILYKHKSVWMSSFTTATWKHRAATHFRSRSSITLGDDFRTVPQIFWHLTSHKMCPPKKTSTYCNPTSDFGDWKTSKSAPGSLWKQIYIGSNLPKKFPKFLNSRKKEPPLPGHKNEYDFCYVCFKIERRFFFFAPRVNKQRHAVVSTPETTQMLKSSTSGIWVIWWSRPVTVHRLSWPWL